MKEDEPREILAKINCIYNLEDVDQTNLLYDEINVSNNFDIYLNDKKINYTNTSIIKGKGKHNITFVIYDKNLNMKNMFKNVKCLTEVEMVAEKKCYLTSMESTFENCTNLKNFSIKGFDTSNVLSFQKLFYKTQLKNAEFKNFNTDNATDMSFMFYSTKIESIDLSFMNTVKVLDMNHMFGDCILLTSIDLAMFDTSNVRNMNHMFSHCESLSELNLENFKTNQVMNMSHIFADCYKLKNLRINNNFDTSSVEDMSNMFENDNNLEEIDVGLFDTKKVKNMKYNYIILI